MESLRVFLKLDPQDQEAADCPVPQLLKKRQCQLKPPPTCCRLCSQRRT